MTIPQGIHRSIGHAVARHSLRSGCTAQAIRGHWNLMQTVMDWTAKGSILDARPSSCGSVNQSANKHEFHP